MFRAGKTNTNTLYTAARSSKDPTLFGNKGASGNANTTSVRTSQYVLLLAQQNPTTVCSHCKQPDSLTTSHPDRQPALVAELFM